MRRAPLRRPVDQPARKSPRRTGESNTQMKSTGWLDLGSARSSKIGFRSTLFDSAKKHAKSITYKKRTEMAESSALERQGLTERLWGVPGSRTVNRYSGKILRILGFLGLRPGSRDCWFKGQWRSIRDSNSRYAHDSTVSSHVAETSASVLGNRSRIRVPAIGMECSWRTPSAVCRAVAASARKPT